MDNNLKYYLTKFRNNPFGMLQRFFTKFVVEPKKYGKKDDYDAQRYWDDRFSKYDLSIRGPGDDGLTENENFEMYQKASQVVINACLKEQVDWQTANVMEIGCGNGYYTQTLQNLGVKNYLGIDITNVLLPKLEDKFPNFKFAQKDITTERIDGQFNLIIMIDVIEHIVNDQKLDFAMENVKNCLAENGVFILASIMKVSKKHLYYVRFWSREEIQNRFPGYVLSELIPFRENYLITIKKAASI